MDDATRKFLEAFFQNVTIDGITRRLEFVEEHDGTSTVKLEAPKDVMPTVYLGFPEEWKPPDLTP